MTEWEKIFAKHIANTGLKPKIYKELLSLNDKKKQKTQFKIGKKSEQALQQRRYTDGK